MLWLMACTPPQELTERQLWESLFFLEDDSLVILRMSQGNTGLFKGQASLRLSRFSSSEQPMEYVMRGTAYDSRFEADNIQIGPQQLYNDGHWNIRIRDALFNVQATLSPSADLPIPLWDTADWTTQLHGHEFRAQGWVQLGEFSTPLSAQAILLEHTGSAVHHSPRELWVLHLQQGSLILIQSEDHIMGYHSSLPHLSLSVAPLQPNTQLSLGEIQLDIGPSKDMGSIDPFEHISTAERLMSSPFFPTHTITIMQGNLTVNTAGQSYPARYTRIITGDID